MSQVTYARDIKADLIAELQKIEPSDTITDVCTFVADIIRQLSQSNVSVTVETVRSSGYTPPAYDPETDGDYSEWLVSHNID